MQLHSKSGFIFPITLIREYIIQHEKVYGVRLHKFTKYKASTADSLMNRSGKCRGDGSCDNKI